jgi:hypothetical protein
MAIIQALNQAAQTAMKRAEIGAGEIARKLRVTW